MAPHSTPADSRTAPGPLPPRGLPWPAAIASIALLALTAALIGRMRALTEGHFVYPLDDSYIHMAIARTMARHGSWGLTAGAFEPASSAPLWTLLLAGLYRVGGVHDWGPVALAALSSVMLIVLGERILRPCFATPLVLVLVLLGIACVVPLPALIVTGMEAPLHAFLTLLLSWIVVRRAVEPRAQPDSAEAAFDLGVGVLALLCVLTRFESAFLIAVLAAAAWVKGRRRTALALAAGSLAALAGYAAVALPHGGLCLPNAVLLKSGVARLDSRADWIGFLLQVPVQLTRRYNTHVTVLLLAAVYLLLPRPAIASRKAAVARGLLVVFAFATLAHVQFAWLGSFYRYEAYLVTLGAFAIVAAVGAGLGAPPRVARRWRAPLRVAVALGWAAVIVPPAVRAMGSMQRAPIASRNIYEQQFQMGHFVRDAFDGQAIAVNDIGAVGYFGESPIVDLVGLATTSVARAKRAGTYDPGTIERLCRERGVRVALVYESWFRGRGGLPRPWRRVGRWTIRDNFICGDPTVSIFATDARDAGRVREALRAFSARLPRRVSVDIPG